MNRRILVVEDDEMSRLLVVAILEDQGYAVEAAGSSEDARSRIRALAPDLVLTDVGLPGEDGVAFTKRLKADPLTAKIPVVAVTASSDAQIRSQALDAGCVALLPKPMDRGLLTRTLAGALVERAG